MTFRATVTGDELRKTIHSYYCPNLKLQVTTADPVELRIIPKQTLSPKLIPVSDHFIFSDGLVGLGFTPVLPIGISIQIANTNVTLDLFRVD